MQAGMHMYVWMTFYERNEAKYEVVRELSYTSDECDFTAYLPPHMKFYTYLPTNKMMMIIILCIVKRKAKEKN